MKFQKRWLPAIFGGLGLITVGIKFGGFWPVFGLVSILSLYFGIIYALTE